MSRLSYRVIHGMKDMFSIAFEELRKIFHDSGVIVIFFAAGLLYPITYGLIYKNETLHDVSIAVVDNSNSLMSRKYIRELDATPDVAVNYHCTDMAQAHELYAQSKVMGIFLIPSSFDKDIVSGMQTHVSVYSSMTSMLYYRCILTAANYVSLNLGARIQIQNLVNKGMTMHEAQVTAAPIENEGVALYNTKSGYASFLVPCVLILIIQQTLVLGVGILAGTEREEHRSSSLIPFQQMYHGTLRIVMGKALAYFIIYAFIAIYNLILMPIVFNLPHIFDFQTLCTFILPFLLAIVFFSMALSVFFTDRESVFLLFLFTSLPLLFMSGSMWPKEQIPIFWRMLSYFAPSTFAIQGFAKLNSMGASITQIGFECMGMWVQAAFYFVLTLIVYRWQIMESERDD